MEDNSRWFQEFEEYNATFVCKENLGFISIRRERRFNQRSLCEGNLTSLRDPANNGDVERIKNDVNTSCQP